MIPPSGCPPLRAAASHDGGNAKGSPDFRTLRAVAPAVARCGAERPHLEGAIKAPLLAALRLAVIPGTFWKKCGTACPMFRAFGEEAWDFSGKAADFLQMSAVSHFEVRS